MGFPWTKFKLNKVTQPGMETVKSNFFPFRGLNHPLTGLHMLAENRCWSWRNTKLILEQEWSCSVSSDGFFRVLALHEQLISKSQHEDVVHLCVLLISNSNLSDGLLLTGSLLFTRSLRRQEWSSFRREFEFNSEYNHVTHWNKTWCFVLDTPTKTKA